jgi:hypothetical protein
MEDLRPDEALEQDRPDPLCDLRVGILLEE